MLPRLTKQHESMQTRKIVSCSTFSPMKVQTKQIQLCINKMIQIYGTLQENVNSAVTENNIYIIYLIV